MFFSSFIPLSPQRLLENSSDEDENRNKDFNDHFRSFLWGYVYTTLPTASWHWRIKISKNIQVRNRNAHLWISEIFHWEIIFSINNRQRRKSSTTVTLHEGITAERSHKWLNNFLFSQGLWLNHSKMHIAQIFTIISQDWSIWTCSSESLSQIVVLHMLNNKLFFGSAIWKNVLKSDSWKITAIFAFLFIHLQLLWFLRGIATIMFL